MTVAAPGVRRMASYAPGKPSPIPFCILRYLHDCSADLPTPFQLYRWQTERAKLWKYHRRNDGQVTQTLSPFAQDIQGSLFHNAPAKALKRVTDNIFDVLPGIVFLIAIPMWSDADFHERSIHHRVGDIFGRYAMAYTGIQGMKRDMLVDVPHIRVYECISDIKPTLRCVLSPKRKLHRSWIIDDVDVIVIGCMMYGTWRGLIRVCTGHYDQCWVGSFRCSCNSKQSVFCITHAICMNLYMHWTICLIHNA